MNRLRLFSKDITPSCSYCRFGFITRDGRSVLCEKNGVSTPHGSCRKFQYAPLKRVPKRPNALPRFDKSDFEL